MTFDPNSEAVLYIWYSGVGQQSPITGTLQRLIERAIKMPKEGVYKIEIEYDGVMLDYASIEAMTGA